MPYHEMIIKCFVYLHCLWGDNVQEFFRVPTRHLFWDLHPSKIIHIDLDDLILWFQKDVLWFVHMLPTKSSTNLKNVSFRFKNVCVFNKKFTPFILVEYHDLTWGLNCMVFRTNSTSCPLSFFSIMATRKRRSDIAMVKTFVCSENKIEVIL